MIIKSTWNLLDSNVNSVFLIIYNLFSIIDFPCGSADKACNVEDLGSIPGLGRSPGEGKGYPFQYSGLENSMDCIVYWVAKSWTRLSDFHFTSLHFSGIILFILIILFFIRFTIAFLILLLLPQRISSWYQSCYCL